MRFMKRVAAVSVCALGVLGSACSGSDGGATPVTLDQYPQAFANALCDTIAPCCKAANVTYQESGCKSAATDEWTRSIAQASAAHTRYDADAAGRCIAAIKSEVATCKLKSDDSTTAVCNSVFVGTIALGGACASSQDCVTPNTCQPDPNNTSAFNTAGVCTAPGAGSVHAKAGEPCLGSCDDTSNAGSCSGSGRLTPGAGGGACYLSDGLYCTFDTQICAAFAKLGEACSEGGCVTGAYCNAGVCAAQIDSGSCAVAPDACSSKSYCDLGQCFAKKQDHFGCNTDAECASGVCAQAGNAIGNTSQGTCGVPSIAGPDLCSGQAQNAPQP